MPLANLPHNTDSETAVLDRIRACRPDINRQLFHSGQSFRIAKTLELEALPVAVKDLITELVATYRVTSAYSTTIGQTLKLLAGLRRRLIPLINGKPPRARDRQRASRFLSRLSDPTGGVYQHTFDALSPLVKQLLQRLQEVQECAACAREIDAVAVHQEALLRLWQDTERKVEGHIEHKRQLCGWLRLVWERNAAPQIRDSKSRRRSFVSAVLDCGSIVHPDANDYQVFDDWIETDVSIGLSHGCEPNPALTVG